VSGGEWLRLTAIEGPANKSIRGFVHEDFLVLDIGRLCRCVVDSPEVLKPEMPEDEIRRRRLKNRTKMPAGDWEQTDTLHWGWTDGESIPYSWQSDGLVGGNVDERRRRHGVGDDPSRSKETARRALRMSSELYQP
jgi:hypothetical protein